MHAAHVVVGSLASGFAVGFAETRSTLSAFSAIEHSQTAFVLAEVDMQTEIVEKHKVEPSQGFDLTAADAVWIATAMLHKEHGIGLSQGFTTEDIVAKVERERLTHAQRRTIYQHVNQHCVANRDPLPNRPRMLFALGQGLRRLWVNGDHYSPQREGSATKPERSALPQQLKHWLDWYEGWSRQHRPNLEHSDPLLGLYGAGKAIWADEHADEYIRRLREGWD